MKQMNLLLNLFYEKQVKMRFFTMFFTIMLVLAREGTCYRLGPWVSGRHTAQSFIGCSFIINSMPRFKINFQAFRFESFVIVSRVDSSVFIKHSKDLRALPPGEENNTKIRTNNIDLI